MLPARGLHDPRIKSRRQGHGELLHLVGEVILPFTPQHQWRLDPFPAQTGDDAFHRPLRAGAVVTRADVQYAGQPLGVFQHGVVATIERALYEYEIWVICCCQL